MQDQSITKDLSKKDNPIYQAQAILARRDHSEYEVRAKLARKGFDHQQVEEGIEFLKERKLLDDEKFARVYIENALRFKPVGPRLLTLQLQRKGVADQYIEPVLMELLTDDKEEQLARASADKWLQTRGPARASRSRLQRYLIMRGFNFDVIQNALEGQAD